MNNYLEKAYNGPFNWERWEFEIREVILNQNDPNYNNFDHVYLIQLSEEIIGFLWVSYYSDEIFWIDTFILEPEHQKRGFGSKVFNILIEDLMKNPEMTFKYIDLGVQKDNETAFAFYNKLGFYNIDDLSMSYYLTQRMRYLIKLL